MKEPTEADINEYINMQIKLKLQEICEGEYKPQFTERQKYFMEMEKKHENQAQNNAPMQKM